MKNIAVLALTACLAMTAACKSAPETPASDTAAANTAIANPPPVTPDAGPSIAGSWVDDENDTYTFMADGMVSSVGQVSMNGNWKADGEDRYAVDLNSPAGLAKGVACVSGDTMAMRIGDGTLTLLGKVGADGKPAKPDVSVTCE